MSKTIIFRLLAFGPFFHRFNIPQSSSNQSVTIHAACQSTSLHTILVTCVSIHPFDSMIWRLHVTLKALCLSRRFSETKSPYIKGPPIPSSAFFGCIHCMLLTLTEANNRSAVHHFKASHHEVCGSWLTWWLRGMHPGSGATQPSTIRERPPPCRLLALPQQPD
eukprot:scaffold232254_cov23-Prasinocladus_malaysianus.AAC.1